MIGRITRISPRFNYLCPEDKTYPLAFTPSASVQVGDRVEFEVEGDRAVNVRRYVPAWQSRERPAVSQDATAGDRRQRRRRNNHTRACAVCGLSVARKKCPTCRKPLHARCAFAHDC